MLDQHNVIPNAKVSLDEVVEQTLLGFSKLKHERAIRAIDDAHETLKDAYVQKSPNSVAALVDFKTRGFFMKISVHAEGIHIHALCDDPDADNIKPNVDVDVALMTHRIRGVARAFPRSGRSSWPSATIILHRDAPLPNPRRDRAPCSQLVAEMVLLMILLAEFSFVMRLIRPTAGVGRSEQNVTAQLSKVLASRSLLIDVLDGGAGNDVTKSIFRELIVVSRDNVGQRICNLTSAALVYLDDPVDPRLPGAQLRVGRRRRHVDFLGKTCMVAPDRVWLDAHLPHTDMARSLHKVSPVQPARFVARQSASEAGRAHIKIGQSVRSVAALVHAIATDDLVGRRGWLGHFLTTRDAADAGKAHAQIDRAVQSAAALIQAAITDELSDAQDGRPNASGSVGGSVEASEYAEHDRSNRSINPRSFGCAPQDAGMWNSENWLT